jgi:transmembrane sensor
MRKSDTPIPDRATDPLSDEALDWLVLLHSGTATAADWDRFAAWRRQSPVHEQASQAAASLWEDLALVRPRPVRRLYLTRKLVKVGTLAALLFLTVFSIWTLNQLDMLFADYATATGEQRTVTLGDGSVVHLDARTALSADFSDKARQLTLHQGQALFIAAPDERRPFEVIAGKGRIQALGTQFEVNKTPREVIVAVLKNKVQVILDHRQGTTQTTAIISQGQSVRYTDTNGLSRIEPIDSAGATAWLRGKLIFNRRPLGEVLTEINRYRAGWIVILDSRLSDLAVTGVLDLSDPDATLRMIERTLPIQVSTLPYVTLLY